MKSPRTGDWQLLKTISRFVLALFMIGAGNFHFVNPAFFLKIMPPYLPLHYELVIISGAFEVVFGVLLLIPRFSRMAAWGIIALLIAVFPANIHLYQNQDILPAPPLLHLLRLPFQGVFILWAFCHTRPVEVQNDDCSAPHPRKQSSVADELRQSDDV